MQMINKSVVIVGDITLSSKSQECMLVSGKPNDWEDNASHRVSGSDFAVANFIEQGDDIPSNNKRKHVVNSPKSVNVLLGSSFKSFKSVAKRIIPMYYIDCINVNGKCDKMNPSLLNGGIRPFFSIKYDADLPIIRASDKNTHQSKKYLVNLGCFANKSVDGEFNQRLEKLFNCGKLRGGLKSTGKWYTTSGVKKWGSSFTPRMVSEFELDGQKYVRSIENASSESCVYEDGSRASTIDQGFVKWFRVDSQEFNILNYESAEKDGEYKLQSKQAMIANFPFSIDGQDDQLSIENSTTYAYLNGIKNEGGDFTHTIHTLSSGEKVCTGYGSFIEDCFLESEKFDHFQIPAWQTEIANYAYQGACHLKSITIPPTVLKMGRHAFDGANFSIFSQTNVGEKIVSSAPISRSDIVFSKDYSKYMQAFPDFSIENVLFDENLNIEQFDDFVEFLNNEKNNIPYGFANKLANTKELDAFIEKADFTGFRRLQKLIPSDISEENLVDFYTFAYNVGCFSKNSNLNKKANNWLEQRIAPIDSKMQDKQGIVHKSLNFDTMHNNFKEWIPQGENEECSEFLFAKSAEKKSTNFQELLNYADWPNFLNDIYGQYANREKYMKVGGRYRDKTSDKLMFRIFYGSKNKNGFDSGKSKDRLPTVEIFREYLYSTKFKGIDNIKDQMVADELCKWVGMKQKHFEIGKTIVSEFYNKKNRHNIVNENLTELTNEIGEYEMQADVLTNESAEQSSQRLDKYANTVSKNFTYEWLDKNDPRNLTLGLYCDCCANLADENGLGIVRAVFVHPDVQNLVIVNKNGVPVAKSTVYVNREQGYAVFNTVKISMNMTVNQTQEIYQSYMRGVNAFAEEYNNENLDNPLKKITVGMLSNDLTEQIKKDGKPSEILEGINFKEYGKTENHYECDWNNVQYLLWSADESKEM